MQEVGRPIRARSGRQRHDDYLIIADAREPLAASKQAHEWPSSYPMLRLVGTRRGGGGGGGHRCTGDATGALPEP